MEAILTFSIHIFLGLAVIFLAMSSLKDGKRIIKSEKKIEELFQKLNQREDK
ncbi:MAG: hypothetical protein GY797_33575 [Deltaproteobacteria bacterium]|nr:hypothetical protein [Deltaproteobacteria bacterium]